MRIKLTDEQRAVVAAQHPELVVRAAAGAGKTAVLVERFLKHVVDDGFQADSILTITFTKKAAAEMKRRIVRALQEAGLREAAQAAETGPIQTIHSFCERVLRENSVEAGLDPDFEVLDEAEGARLQLEAIHAAIAEATEQEEPLIELLAGKRDREAVSPHAKLESVLGKALLELRGSGQSVQILRESHQDPETVLGRWQAMYLENLEPAIREAFENENQALGFVGRIRAAHKALRRKVPAGVPGEADLEEAEAANSECAKWSSALVTLTCRAWERFDQSLGEARALDFTALEAEAVAILRSSEPIQERIRRQFRVALVDEAQDLSPLQCALLDAMGLEVEMRVGDAHQSIYAFRQADVELFLEQAQRAETLILSKNYRSTEGILAFVDSIFARLWGESYVKMGPESELGEEAPSCDGVEIWRQKVRDTGQVAAWIEGLIQNGEEHEHIAVLVRVSQYAQDLLPRLEALGIPARIAGGSERFYTRLEVRDLANALRAVECPSDDFALLAMLRSPIVGLSLDSIVHLALRKPVADALSDFEPPVEDDRPALARLLEWYRPLMGLGDRLSAWEALAIIFAQSDYLPNVVRRPNGRQSLANVRKLLRLAAERPEESPAAYARTLREIAELRHREGDAPASSDDDAVTIMTVHKAKGLEFPVVVLPDTHRALCRNRGEVEIDKRLGSVTAHFGGPRVAMFHEWIAERRKERERAEELRLLYVGMTRAKRRLCIVADPQARSNSVAKAVAEEMGLPDHLPTGVLERK